MKINELRGTVDSLDLPDMDVKISWPSQAFHFTETGVIGCVGSTAWGFGPGLFAGACAGLLKELSSITMWLINGRPEDMTVPEALVSEHLKGEYKDLAFHTAGALVGALVGVIF